MLKKLLGVALLLSIAGNIYLFIEVNKLNKSLNQTVSAETRTTISNQAPEQGKRETVKTVITTENPIGQQQTIAALVLNKDYYGAVNKLAEASEQLRAKYLEKWLKAVAELINDDKFTDAEQFLQAILQDYPDNLPALKLNVELLLAQKMTKEAVFASYNIRHHVFDIKQEDAIINDARKLALSEAMRLKSLKAWQLQKTFAQDVLSIDFNFERMQLVLANAEYRLREYNHAQSLALSLVDNPELTTLASQLLEKIELAMQPKNIPMDKNGQHYIVRGLVNEEVEVELMLDTGASISLISEQAFHDLSLHYDAEYIQNIQMNTAGGEITAAVYRFKAFELNGYRVNNMLFAVSPLELSAGMGLLGMNFLRHFDFYIDQKNHVLTLENKH